MPGGGVYYQGRFYLLIVKINPSGHMVPDRNTGAELVKRAAVCKKSGCDGICVRLDPLSNITQSDLSAIDDASHGNLNIEIPSHEQLPGVVPAVKPLKVVIDLHQNGTNPRFIGSGIKADDDGIKKAVNALHDRDILVSFRIDTDIEVIEHLTKYEPDFIQIDTGAYCRATSRAKALSEINRIYNAAAHAVEMGVKVSAGHALDCSNIEPVLKARALEEITIGHSIFARAVQTGLPEAVGEALEMLE